MNCYRSLVVVVLSQTPPFPSSSKAGNYLNGITCHDLGQSWSVRIGGVIGVRTYVAVRVQRVQERNCPEIAVVLLCVRLFTVNGLACRLFLITN